MDDKEYTIDLMEVAEILKENCKPIARITGCVIGAAILYLLIAWNFFPTYESEAMLQIRQKNSVGGLGALLTGMSADFLNPASSSMDSYIEILKSRGVILPVIEATAEKNLFGEYPDYRSYVNKQIRAEAAKGSNKLTSTNILLVSVKARTPDKAQQATQMLVNNFLKRVAELNSAEKGSEKSFLEERLKTSKEDLNKAEIALQKFKEENKILSPTSSVEIFTERIMEVEKQAAINKVEMEAAQAKLAAINSQLGGSGAASADNVTIQKYNTELAKLEAERISYLDKYTEKHPKMIEVNDRIAKLKSKVQEEINKVATLQAPSDNEVHQALVAGKYQSEGEVAVSRQKAAALQQVIDQNNAEIEKLPAVEREYVILERDFKVASEIYMLLTKQLEQTKITEFQQPSNVLIVDSPYLPGGPVSPRRGLTLVLAALLGLLGSAGYIVLQYLANRPIRSVDTIIEYIDLPVFGVIPDNNHLEKNSAIEQRTKMDSILSKLKEFIWKK